MKETMEKMKYMNILKQELKSSIEKLQIIDISYHYIYNYSLYVKKYLFYNDY